MMQAENKWFLDNNKQRRWKGKKEREKEKIFFNTVACPWPIEDNKQFLPVLNLMSQKKKKEKRKKKKEKKDKNVNDENSQRKNPKGIFFCITMSVMKISKEWIPKPQITTCL